MHRRDHLRDEGPATEPRFEGSANNLPALAEAVARGLRAEGHAVDPTSGCATVVAAPAGVDHDAVVLDLNLPNGSDLALLRAPRAAYARS
ncbi:hypothetical protein V8J36_17085 [Frigidibacter sp. MR17.14]|uniref:hypothetical protein n=1 Tax=Frigidibacter sp. MR17.14 TaxID=3126509 RepID=UPI00301300D9